MSIGLIGRKVGMTQIFQENGDAVPVTVLKARVWLPTERPVTVAPLPCRAPPSTCHWAPAVTAAAGTRVT